MKRFITLVCALFLVLNVVYVMTASRSDAAKEPVPVVSGGPAAGAKPVAVPAVIGKFVPLYNSSTKLEPPMIIDTPTALITRIGDRGRDRHAREWMFHAYEHYLALYWVDRTMSIEIVDTIPKGGTTIIVNLVSMAPLNLKDVRAFFESKYSIAQYSCNEQAKETSPLHYTATIRMNTNERRPLKVGDLMEMEISGFIKLPFEGRTNYYGTGFLYIVGQGGMHPWEWHETDLEAAHKAWTREADDATHANRPVKDVPLGAYPLPELAMNGGMTTGHESYSEEPKSRFDQMSTNISPINTQPFMLGRRLAHTDFITGVHSEPDNPIFKEHVGGLGTRFSAPSCATCKGAMPSAVNTVMQKYLVKVASDAKGTPHPQLGSVLQPMAGKGTTSEGSVAIASWTTVDGTYGDGTKYTLQKPVYKFTGVTPEFYSVRLAISKPYGMGLLEAIDENTIAGLATLAAKNDNGGHMSLVTDPTTGQLRMGRYGYKAAQASLKDQIAKRLNDAMGITTSIYPKADCGSAQTDASIPAKLVDAELEQIYRYYSLRAVPPRRGFRDEVVKKGEALFASAGCVSCHVPTIKTGSFHPMTELRDQTIHVYSDLLLHDMGEGLADNLGEGSATGAEWRTAPLWGLGLLEPAMDGKAVYLHDGRATTLNEAILWHGGWAYSAKENFRKLSADDRAALIKFLKSL